MESELDSQHRSRVLDQASGSGLPRSGLRICPQGRLPRQDFCLRRACPKKGPEGSSAQIYCLFLFKRVRWEWSRGERDLEANSLRLFPTEGGRGTVGLEVGGDGGGRVSSSQAPGASQESKEWVGDLGKVPQRGAGSVSRVTLSLLRVRASWRVGLGASVVSETLAGCSCPMPTPKDQSSPCQGTATPHILTEYTTGVLSAWPSPPPPST